MAFNLAALKGLFSKLKPAAKAVANYGDDAAKALTTYGDDVAQMTFANADDLAAAMAQSAESAKYISDADIPTDIPNRMWINGASNAPEQPWYRSPNYDARPTPKQVLQQADYDSPYGSTKLTEMYADSEFSDDVLEMMADDHIDLVYNTQTRPVGSFTKPENTDDLISYLNGADSELDSFNRLDPNAYKSGLDGTPDLDSTLIDPQRFPGYNSKLEGSFTYPDGFYDPDGAAMYYDSLERGYIPEEYGNVDYFSYREPAYHPVHGQVRKRIDDQVSNRITYDTHAPARTSMDIDNPTHRGILDDYYEYLSSYPKNTTPRDPVFLSKYPYRYHYPWEYNY